MMELTGSRVYSLTAEPVLLGYRIVAFFPDAAEGLAFEQKLLDTYEGSSPSPTGSAASDPPATTSTQPDLASMSSKLDLILEGLTKMADDQTTNYQALSDDLDQIKTGIANNAAQITELHKELSAANTQYPAIDLSPLVAKAAAIRDSLNSMNDAGTDPVDVSGGSTVPADGSGSAANGGTTGTTGTTGTDPVSGVGPGTGVGGTSADGTGTTGGDGQGPTVSTDPGTSVPTNDPSANPNAGSAPTGTDPTQVTTGEQASDPANPAPGNGTVVDPAGDGEGGTVATDPSTTGNDTSEDTAGDHPDNGEDVDPSKN